MEKVIHVVDDDHVVLDVICGQLEHAGYRVESYADPASFLTNAPALADGCIILDLEMPGMSGLEVQSRLTELGCKLPIIFYSGKARVRDAVGGMQAGAVDFLGKSSDAGPLLKAVRNAVGPAGNRNH